MCEEIPLEGNVLRVTIGDNRRGSPSGSDSSELPAFWLRRRIHWCRFAGSSIDVATALEPAGPVDRQHGRKDCRGGVIGRPPGSPDC